MSIERQNVILEGLNVSRNIPKVDEMTGPEFKKKAESNPVFRKMDSICKKYGYVLEIAYKRKWDEGTPAEVVIEIRPKDRMSLQPEIYYQSHYGEAKNFEINPSAGGSMNLKDYEDFMKKIRGAYDLVKELSKVDLNALEESPLDFD